MEPFIGSAAVRRGELTRRGLARDHRPIYRDVYLAREMDMTARLRAQAAWLSTGATLCGRSAAAILGTKWLDPSAPAEIIRADRHAPTGIVAHSWRIAEDELCEIGGVSLTSRPAPRSTSDALFNATRLTPDAVMPLLDRHCGVRGSSNLRAALAVVDGGAESPQESRLRMLIVDDGLPRPETQIKFPDLQIRVDMGWREWKVAVEYDGVQHWTDGRQRSWDIERINRLEDIGWIVVRVSAEMLRRPAAILSRILAALRARGCPV